MSKSDLNVSCHDLSSTIGYTSNSSGMAPTAQKTTIHNYPGTGMCRPYQSEHGAPMRTTIQFDMQYDAVFRYEDRQRRNYVACMNSTAFTTSVLPAEHAVQVSVGDTPTYYKKVHTQ